MRRSDAWGLALIRKELKRKYGCGHLHFVPFSRYRGLPLLATVPVRALLVKILREVCER